MSLLDIFEFIYISFDNNNLKIYKKKIHNESITLTYCENFFSECNYIITIWLLI